MCIRDRHNRNRVQLIRVVMRFVEEQDVSQDGGARRAASSSRPERRLNMRLTFRMQHSQASPLSVMAACDERRDERGRDRSA